MACFVEPVSRGGGPGVEVHAVLGEEREHPSLEAEGDAPRVRGGLVLEVNPEARFKDDLYED